MNNCDASAWLIASRNAVRVRVSATGNKRKEEVAGDADAWFNHQYQFLAEPGPEDDDGLVELSGKGMGARIHEFCQGSTNVAAAASIGLDGSASDVRWLSNITGGMILAQLA